MELSYSVEASSFSDNQIIPSIYRTTNFWMCSNHSATCIYPEAHSSSPHHTIYLSQIHLNNIIS